MLKMTESMIVIQVPGESDMEPFPHNITLVVTEIEESILKGDPAQEEKLITDVWVGIVLTLLVLSCVACMCSCIIYHRFQVWKRDVLRTSANGNLSGAENGNADTESLPSYTIVSGLPSYDEALQQLKVVKQALADGTTTAIPTPTTPPAPSLTKLSVTELLQLYRQPQQSLECKDEDKS